MTGSELRGYPGSVPENQFPRSACHKPRSLPSSRRISLGIKLAQVGRIFFCPASRMGHFHAPSGRVSVMVAAEDDLFNRFMVMHKTLGRPMLRSLVLVLCFLSIESLSNFLGACKRMKLGTTLDLLVGRLRGLIQVGRFCLRLRN
jgi:hypothetical protein